MNINVQSFAEVKEIYRTIGAWGLLSSLDIKQADPDLIRSREAITRYIIELCDRIGMRRFGDPRIVHFGEAEAVAGYSMTQLIETSLISGHFANQTGNVYIDIFSCKVYDPYGAADFTRDFFKGRDCLVNILFRQ
jgi:S-adenosylmethionine/arginine decarboxylase-like enzyme